jgi:hypothetical protein
MSDRPRSTWNLEALVTFGMLSVVLQGATTGFLAVHDYRYAFAEHLGKMCWSLDAFVLLRVSIAFIVGERNDGWKYYCVTMLSSPFWVLLLARIEIAAYDAASSRQFHLGELVIPSVLLCLSILGAALLLKTLERQQARRSTAKELGEGGGALP